MKLNVDFSSKENKPQEECEIVLEFMEGDADGDRFPVTVDFEEAKA